MTEPIEPEIVNEREGKASCGSCAAANRFSRNSGKLLLLRGILVLLAGLLMFYNPQATIIYTIMFFGVYILCEGIFSLIRTSREMPDGTQPFGCTGIFLTVLGAVMIAAPWKLSEMAVLFLGIWLLISGFGTIAGAGMRTAGGTISGALSILCGIFFLAAPWIGIATLGWMIAIPFLLSGIAMIYGALVLSRVKF